MSAVRITSFGGIYPRTSPRLLPDNAAQVAVNCRLTSGELVPYNAPKWVYTSAKPGPLATIYRAYEDGTYDWFTWAETVNVVKAPLSGVAKWCWTGEYEPRIATLAMATSGGGGTYPNTSYMLGVASPQTAPNVVSTGGTGATVDRYYAYTFVSSWDEEGGVSPLSTLVTGKVDGVWTITNMDESPANSGVVTGVYSNGNTTFTGTEKHWLRVGEYVVINGDTLQVKAVNSPLSFTVAGDYSASTTWSRKTPWNTTTKRLYRTSGDNKQFQLVAEGITSTTYIDTLADDEILGDELISSDWIPPPPDLKGLRALPSGALCGFVGNTVYFSEPDQPHAWPTAYKMMALYPVVAVESFGTGVVVATEAAPFIITGVEPGQMSGQSWIESLPCLSAASVVGVGDAVAYVSTVGVVLANSAGVTRLSEQYFTRHDFNERSPSTTRCAFADNKLWVLYNTGTDTRLLVFHVGSDGGYLSEVHVTADTIYADGVTGKLYFASGSDIYEFDPIDGYPMSIDWMHKQVVLSRPMNLGAAQIDFETAIDPAVAAAIKAKIDDIKAANAALMVTGNVHSGWNTAQYNVNTINGSDLTPPPAVPPSNEITFQLYTRDVTGAQVLRAMKVVTSNKPFSLPSGYKADSAIVRVTGQCRVNAIELGPTKQSLGDA